MQFDECYEGDYRIFVGALDAPRGDGFIAAVVVSRMVDDDPPGTTAPAHLPAQTGTLTIARAATQNPARTPAQTAAHTAVPMAAQMAAHSAATAPPDAAPPRARGGPAGRRAREVWRDDSLACGYRWPTPEAALHYAKNRAREMVRKASPMLASSAG